MEVTLLVRGQPTIISSDIVILRQVISIFSGLSIVLIVRRGGGWVGVIGYYGNLLLGNQMFTQSDLYKVMSSQCPVRAIAQRHAVTST